MKRKESNHKFMFCVMWLTSDTRADYIFASKLISDATTSWVIKREKKKMRGFTCGNHSDLDRFLDSIVFTSSPTGAETCCVAALCDITKIRVTRTACFCTCFLH